MLCSKPDGAFLASVNRTFAESLKWRVSRNVAYMHVIITYQWELTTAVYDTVLFKPIKVVLLCGTVRNRSHNEAVSHLHLGNSRSREALTGTLG